MKRSSPIRKRRGARRGPWRSETKRRWIASLPCLITGRASQCAHVGPHGLSQKASDECTVPLAPEIHDQLDGRAPLRDWADAAPNYRRKAFEYVYCHELRGKELIDIAAQLHQQWLAKTGKAKVA